MNRVNRLIAAGSETRFPARRKHVTLPPAGITDQAGAGTGAWPPARQDIFHRPCLHPTFFTSPPCAVPPPTSTEIRTQESEQEGIRGGTEAGEASGLVQAGARLARLAPPCLQFPVLGNLVSRGVCVRVCTFQCLPITWGGVLDRLGGGSLFRAGRACPRSPGRLARGYTSFHHPRAAAVVVVAMTTGGGFIFNSGQRLHRCLRRAPRSSRVREDATRPRLALAPDYRPGRPQISARPELLLGAPGAPGVGLGGVPRNQRPP